MFIVERPVAMVVTTFWIPNFVGRQVGSNSHTTHLGQSIFEYIEKHHAKSPVFFNFAYEKGSPASKVSSNQSLFFSLFLLCQL